MGGTLEVFVGRGYFILKNGPRRIVSYLVRGGYRILEKGVGPRNC